MGRAGYCVNHPGRPADIRCIQCQKPLCGDCVIRDEGDPFCSRKCASRYRTIHRSYEEAHAKRPVSVVVRRVIVGVLIAVIVLLLLSIAGWAGWGPAEPIYRVIRRLLTGGELAGEIGIICRSAWPLGFLAT